MPRPVIFDCDGVLVDSEVLSVEAERSVLADLGLAYDKDAYVEKFCGMHDGLFFEAAAEALEAHTGRAAPIDLPDRMLAARRARAHLLDVIKGAAEALQAAEVKAVASSSATGFLEKKLRRTDLWDLVSPHVYSADLVPHGKPAPDIFLYAAEKIGAAPADCIVLEDSVNGVKAGLAAGMTVWGFLGGGHVGAAHGDRLKAAGAHEVLPDMASVTQRLSTV